MFVQQSALDAVAAAAVAAWCYCTRDYLDCAKIKWNQMRMGNTVKLQKKKKNKKKIYKIQETMPNNKLWKQKNKKKNIWKKGVWRLYNIQGRHQTYIVSGYMDLRLRLSIIYFNNWSDVCVYNKHKRINDGTYMC